MQFTSQTTLFVDTETTGLPLRDGRDDDPRQPRLVQVAALLHDAAHIECAAIDLIVDPGAPIPSAATAVHRIDQHIATVYGVPEKGAIGIVARLMSKARVVVAHNAAFDLQILGFAASRAGFSLRPPPSRCTMLAAAPIVNLPPTERMVAAGFTKPKSPKLAEAAEFFFGERHEKAHSALPDVRMCARVYYELVARGVWSGEQAA